MTHICITKLTIIGSDNGLSPGQGQAIVWTNAEILLIPAPGTKFIEILMEIHTLSFKKMHLKIAPILFRPQCVNHSAHYGQKMPYGCINLCQHWLMACCRVAPSHYLNCCWLIINEDTCQIHSKSIHFHWKNALQNICKMATILLRPQCGKIISYTTTKVWVVRVTVLSWYNYTLHKINYSNSEYVHKSWYSQKHFYFLELVRPGRKIITIQQANNGMIYFLIEWHPHICIGASLLSLL